MSFVTDFLKGLELGRDILEFLEELSDGGSSGTSAPSTVGPAVAHVPPSNGGEILRTSFDTIANNTKGRIPTASAVQQLVLNHELESLRVEQAALRSIGAGTTKANARIALVSADHSNDQALLAAATNLYKRNLQ